MYGFFTGMHMDCFLLQSIKIILLLTFSDSSFYGVRFAKCHDTVLNGTQNNYYFINFVVVFFSSPWHQNITKYAVTVHTYFQRFTKITYVHFTKYNQVRSTRYRTYKRTLTKTSKPGGTGLHMQVFFNNNNKI